MKKLLPLILLALSCSTVFGQEYSETRKLDSLRIDHLKKSLVNLKSTKRIDALIDISMKTYDMPMTGGFVTKTDSVKKYAAQALQEATAAGYKRGRAMALLFTEANTDSVNYENAKEALHIGEEIRDEDLTGWSYYRLANIEMRITRQNKSWSENLVNSAEHFRKAGNIRMEAEVTNWICSMSISKLYDNDKGFQYCQRAMELGSVLKKTKTGMNEFLYQYAIGNMSNLYNEVGDYKTSLFYLNMARQFSTERNMGYDLEDQYGELYSLMGNHDSAIYYLRKFKEIAPRNPIGANEALGKGYIRAGRFSEALPLLQEATGLIRKKKFINPIWLSSTYIYTGKAFAGLAQYDSALVYAKNGYEMAKASSDNLLMQEGAESLANIYEHLGRSDSAYYYLKQHIQLKDSLQSKQFLWRLNNQLYQSQRSVEEQKRTSRLELRLKQQAMQKNSLIIILSAFSLTGFLVYRNINLKRRNDNLRSKQLEQTLAMQQLEMDKKHAEFVRRYAYLEMQALRAQMKPHFIFNSLGSINAYILNHDIDKASDYLSRFSKLIRMVLNAQQPLIPLEDELKMLQLYLDMERLRLDDRFDYRITFRNAVDAGDIKILPMLLQPFCENAIWHGLAPKQGKGLLQIEVGTGGGILHCVITDDGIGRERSQELKRMGSKNTSKGLQITRERLALLNQEKNVEADFQIEDLYDEQGEAAGTRVTLCLAYSELIQEVA